jgi:hypothetical protein
MRFGTNAIVNSMPTLDDRVGDISMPPSGASGRPTAGIATVGIDRGHDRFGCPGAR